VAPAAAPAFTGVGVTGPAPDLRGDGHGLALAAELAHDVRSPVSAIHALAEGLQAGSAGPVTPLQYRQLALIRSAAFSLCSVTRDMEDLARESTVSLVGAPVPFSIRAVFAVVQDLVAPLREIRAIALRFQGVPPGTDHRLGHPSAVSRVLLNLTTNALQATDQGAVDVIARALDEQWVEFSVRDTGRGLDARLPATGLGLTICRNILSALGSSLDVTSRMGAGTRFSFALDLPPIVPQSD